MFSVPCQQAEFRAALEAYLSELSLAAFKLLEAFSLGLGLPAQALHPVFGVSGLCSCVGGWVDVEAQCWAGPGWPCPRMQCTL